MSLPVYIYSYCDYIQINGHGKSLGTSRPALSPPAVPGAARLELQLCASQVRY
jgi:hypothetical protein